jgi:predicted metal-dependent phosphoesterase TrpH
MMPLLRADLHVHTCHSKITGTMRFLGSRDCYSQPADVYRVA